MPGGYESVQVMEAKEADREREEAESTVPSIVS
jgi:hypothetical protein